MSRFIKILISLFILCFVILIAVILTLQLKKDVIFEKLVHVSNDKLNSYGYSMSYNNASIDVFPPRVSLSDLRITAKEDNSHVLDAKKAFIYLNPIMLIIPGASPFRVHMEGFVGRVDNPLMSLFLDKSDRGEKKSGGEPFSIPTVILKDGFLDFRGPYKFIQGGMLSVDYLYFSGNYWEGLGIIYKTGDEGISGSFTINQVTYPLVISRLELNTHISSKKVEIKKINVQSPSADLSLSGYYDLDKENLKGLIRGDISPQRLVTDLHLSVPENLFRGGTVTITGEAALRKGILNVDVATKFIDLNISGLECSGYSSCVYDDGKLSLKKLSLSTPVGTLMGELSFDTSRFIGEGVFDIVDFHPGKLANFLSTDTGLGIEGTGKGRLVFSMMEKGILAATSAFRMEKGFTLLLKGTDEKIAWTEPVDLTGETIFSDIFKHPNIEIKRLVVGDENNRISLRGNLDLLTMEGITTCDIDISQVRSLELKGVFARSGAIRGKFVASGELTRPMVETSLSLKELSISGLPVGNMLIKGSGILGSNISLIADYSSTIGNVTFTGTFFPDKDLYFAGSLKARNLEIGPFSSDKFLQKDLFATLSKRFPMVFPVSGNVQFEGDVFLGRDTFRAKGELSSDIIRSPKVSLQSVRGEVEFDDGNLRIGDISFSAFGGKVRTHGIIEDNLFELSGDFSGVDPGTLNVLMSENSDIIGGKSLEGTFHLRSYEDRVDQLDIHLTSDQITFQEAELTMLTIDGKTTDDIFVLTLSTSNELASLELQYDFQDSDLLCEATFRNFPLKIEDKPFDGSLGKLGISISGSSTFALKNIAKIPDSLLDLIFSADTMQVSLNGTPYLSLYQGGLPDLIVTAKKREGRIISKVSTDESSGEVNVIFSKGKRGDLEYAVQGQVYSGTLPFVLPSNILAAVETMLNIDLEGKVSSFPGESKGRFVFQDLNIEFPGEKISGDKLIVTLEKGKLTVEDALLSSNQRNFLIEGIVNQDGNIDLSLTGAYDAGLVNAVVKDVFEKITGTVIGNIRIAGKIPNIEVSGQGKGKNVYIKFVGFKHPLENMNTDITFFKDRILFDSIDGQISGGDMEGSGEVNIVPGGPVRLSFDADFYSVNFSYPQELPSQLEGSIELLGPVNDLFLRGEIFVNKAVYTKPIYPEKLIVDIQKKIDRFNAPIGRGFAINLDIDCISDGTIYIRNNIADATARGSFRILGDTSQPVIIGTFETIEGEVEYSGTQYIVDRLIVDFDNPVSNNPNIDAFANAEKGEYTIFVEVTGRLDNYSVEFYSEPPLSKNDIVSLLSLGVTTEEFAEEDSSVTTAGVATVALAPLKTQIEEGIRTFTGFERFSVAPNFSPSTGVVEPTLVIGKTVGDRFSVDVSTSLTGSGTANFIGEYRLIRDLYLRGDWSSSTSTTGGDTGQIGGELRVKKRFHSIAEFGEKLFGGESW